MSTRGPLKVSGLISSGKVTPNPNVEPITEFGAPSGNVPSPDWNIIKVIPLTLVDDSPYQVRQLYDASAIDNLAHTLATAGQQEPIVVRPVNGRYELVSGHRRTRAAKSLGWIEIKASVREMHDAQAEAATMVANEAREDLSDYERAKLYKRAIERGMARTQTDVANFFGTSQGFVSKCLKMLELPAPYLHILEDRPDVFGNVVAATIRELLNDYPEHHELVEKAVLRIVHDQADQVSVKGWFLQMLRLRESKTTIDKSVVTDSTGRPLYTAKSKGRDIIVRINASEIKTEEVLERVLKALKTSE